MADNRRRVLLVVLALFLVPMASAGAAVLANDVLVTSGAHFQTDSGVVIETSSDLNLPSGNPFTDNETLAVPGGTISGSGTASLTLDSMNGSTTAVSSLDVDVSAVRLAPNDKRAITVSGDATSLSYKALDLSAGQTDLTYAGPSGTTTLVIEGLSAGDDVRAVETSSGSVLDAARVASDGTLTLYLPNSEHDVDLQEVDSGVPVVVDGTASPTGEQSTPPSELGVNITDDDFPGDEVEVTLALDGVNQSSTNITADGRVSTSINGSALAPGQHTWTVYAVDQYGNAIERQFTFGIPDELEIRKEHAPDELVTKQVNVTIYAGDDVYTRTTTDGTISLEGLPVNERLVVETRADGYLTRQIVVDSLIEHQTIYLLNASEVTTVEVRFTLTDRTGRYPEESSELYVKKPITLNGTTTYRTVAADTFGVQGYTTVLEEGQRYRLVVENSEGDMRVIGTYTPTISETVELQIERTDPLGDDLSEQAGYQWFANQSTTTVDEDGSQVERDVIRFSFSDPDGETDYIDVEIYERGNRSNNTIFDERYSGLGNITFTQVLDAEQSNTTWVVEFAGERNGEAITGQRVLGSDLTEALSLGLSPHWRSVIAIGSLVVLAGLFGGVRAELGAIVVTLVAGVWHLVGWMPAEVTGGSIIVALLVAILHRIHSARGVGL